MSRLPLDMVIFFMSPPLQLQAFQMKIRGLALLGSQLLSFCTFLGDSLISWNVKKQPTMSCSSPKSENRTLAGTTSELVWIAQLLADFSDFDF